MDGALGGTWRESSAGRSFVVSHRFTPEASWGAYRVGEFAEFVGASSAAARIVGANPAPAPLVFFDLETTGLSGGAGTHAFLVGCGWFDAEGGFLVEQHVMTDYASERSMLGVVAEELSRAGTLVTFNGKSFDAPVLDTRYLFHRLEPPCGGRPHVDMLHPARRFWGGTPEADCSLVTLEALVLGARRVGDVPGCEIPARYFQFIRSGDAGPLEAVLEHNRFDLLSLAGLTARVFHLVDEGPRAARDAREALALGRLYARAGLNDRADEAFEHAVTSSGALTSLALVKVEALRALARGARRVRRYDAAAARWRALLEVPRCPPCLAREAIQALAVHHEYRVRDLATAKAFALRSLEIETGHAWGDAARHRLARIERKIVSERAPLFPSSPAQPSSGSPTSARQTSS